MNTIPAQEIKRRGIGAVDEALTHGPVHVVRSNRPRYVVLSEEDYDIICNELAETRLAFSLADLKAGRISRGTAAQLMAQLQKSNEHGTKG